ncbi:MAG: hypothetical protein Sv326_0432 [Candidatus Fermentimicrarchaeum limneticum]|uniref:Uncharacterized protein n=1 Tax=Fermentimicrarchaeum limneticum TaxID=2795018 RepID=A0A7D5XPJ6_FERL1|nr:MAG: hypothetical protein Sv326_0358 [Candidatus Fermentimicrarchaeum limneticum]QLJ52570.1 MAG: hypothetical protein Sv326_0395 [Candidatus Fermentimicrarchaeum limneticum]QLJ52607.1 MAG: hypothetical protein Sv326_0432 [Candidatus Fermentimicrarchaeum limneticum]
MTKQFKELVLEKDTVFEESIEVETSIRCAGSGRYNLTVKGDINAGDITAWDITARDINARDINAGDITAGDITAGDITAGDITAGDINARDINAGDITAGDINAGDIICESRKKKTKTAKTTARFFITERSKLQKKEW